MLKRLYKQPKKIGKEIDAILKQLSLTTDNKLAEQNITINKTISRTTTLTSKGSRIFTFFMS